MQMRVKLASKQAPVLGVDGKPIEYASFDVWKLALHDIKSSTAVCTPRGRTTIARSTLNMKLDLNPSECTLACRPNIHVLHARDGSPTAPASHAFLHR
jgi:hypothetical protein